MLFRTSMVVGIATAAVLLTSSGMAKEYKGHKFKGTVEEVENGKLVVRDSAHEPIEFLVTTDTDITRDEKPASLGELQVGDVAILTARRVNKRFIAIRIFAMEPE